MEFKLIIRKLVIDIDSGAVLSSTDTQVSTATVEQVHACLSSGDNRIWDQRSPAAINA